MEKKAIISKGRVNKTSKSLIHRKETSEKVFVDNWGYASIRNNYIYWLIGFNNFLHYILGEFIPSLIL